MNYSSRKKKKKTPDQQNKSDRKSLLESGLEIGNEETRRISLLESGLEIEKG
jgi:hypothetical protein